MVSTTTTVCDFGWNAVDFSLKGTDGETYTLDGIKGDKGALVMFISNHCPYVKAIHERLVRDIKEVQAMGFGVIAIMSNDPDDYPEDSFDNMKAVAEEKGFTFPYVLDGDQRVVREYGAVCTPDFFAFNADMKLQYRGRLDASGRNPEAPDTRRELIEAMTQIAETGTGPTEQTPSIGCSIKWRE